MRIPFDNVALSAIIAEVEPYVGGFVQEIRQPDENTITLQIYRRSEGEKGREGVLLLSVHPQFARIGFVTRRPGNAPSPPAFCAALRSRIQGAELLDIQQVAADRIVMLSFETEKGNHVLVAELMGKHSNLMLLDNRRVVVAAAKWIPASKSSRSILPNIPYQWPPVVDVESIDPPSPTSPGDWLAFGKSNRSRISPFFRALIENDSVSWSEWSPTLAQGIGAYPLDIRSAGVDAFSRSSFSIALEQYYATAEIAYQIESLRANLIGQVDRVVQARDFAIADVEHTLELDRQADSWRRTGELILAYGPSAIPGMPDLTVYDFEGNLVVLQVDPKLGFVENAQLYFDRAKRAKSRVEYLQANARRLEQDRTDALRFRDRVLASQTLIELQELKEFAKDRKWSNQQVVAKTKEDRPFEGHRVRELFGPGGIRVLFGENSESNDYLTQRVAKPNDYWLHVRGSASAHVVVVTENSPEKVGREQLMFAAKVAVSNSPSKHAGYVPVDYTLKKYVRKPRGSASGAAVYTNEKTLHVES